MRRRAVAAALVPWRRAIADARQAARAVRKQAVARPRPPRPSPRRPTPQALLAVLLSKPHAPEGPPTRRHPPVTVRPSALPKLLTPRHIPAPMRRAWRRLPGQDPSPPEGVAHVREVLRRRPAPSHTRHCRPSSKKGPHHAISFHRRRTSAPRPRSPAEPRLNPRSAYAGPWSSTVARLPRCSERPAQGAASQAVRRFAPAPRTDKEAAAYGGTPQRGSVESVPGRLQSTLGAGLLHSPAQRRMASGVHRRRPRRLSKQRRNARRASPAR
jgi:hypothetical protein